MSTSNHHARSFTPVQERLLIRVGELKVQVSDSLGLAIDLMMESQSELYAGLEDHLSHISFLTDQILMGISESYHLHELRTYESRLNFLEDRFDEMDSRLRNRPRKRRNRINMADFFAASQGGFMGNPTPEEAQTAREAYEILGLNHGSPLDEVIRAFRRKVKELHPDSRSGDRSSEPELRRLLAAYQFLKSYGG